MTESETKVVLSDWDGLLEYIVSSSDYITSCINNLTRITGTLHEDQCIFGDRGGTVPQIGRSLVRSGGPYARLPSLAPPKSRRR